MWKVYVGNLDSRVRERELADEFRTYGNVRSVWVARNPPGYAFIEFDDRRDAEDSVSALDGKHGWRVEMSRKSVGGRGRASYGSERCYDCGGIGHFARECRYRSSRYSRRRSPSPLHRRSDSHRRTVSHSDRDGSLSPRRDRHRSYRERSSPRRKRERSRSLDSDRSEDRGHNAKVRRHSSSPEHGKSDSLSPHREDRELSRTPQNEPERIEHDQSRSPQNDEPDLREANHGVKEGSRSPLSEKSGELRDHKKEGFKQNGTPQGEESDMEGDGSPVLRDDSRSPPPDNVGSLAQGNGSPVLRDDSRSPRPSNVCSFVDGDGSVSRDDSKSPQPVNGGSDVDGDGSPVVHDDSRSRPDHVGSYMDGDGSPVLRGGNKSPRPDNAGSYADGDGSVTSVRNGETGSKSPRE